MSPPSIMIERAWWMECGRVGLREAGRADLWAEKPFTKVKFAQKSTEFLLPDSVKNRLPLSQRDSTAPGFHIFHM